MEKPVITDECVKPLFETKFIRLYDLQYAEGRHYYTATRRTKENLTALLSEEEFCGMVPDAVSCFVILKTPDQEPKLLLSYEYRYPTGHFLLSPPAGLIDEEDQRKPHPALSAAVREIAEETGIRMKDTDLMAEISPCAFSSPGMTDEANALVAAVITLEDLDALDQTGAVGSECFDGFELLTRQQAEEVLRAGRDKFGHYFSVYTFCALLYFVTGQWM